MGKKKKERKDVYGLLGVDRFDLCVCRRKARELVWDNLFWNSFLGSMRNYRNDLSGSDDVDYYVELLGEEFWSDYIKGRVSLLAGERRGFKNALEKVLGKERDEGQWKSMWGECFLNFFDIADLKKVLGEIKKSEKYYKVEDFEELNEGLGKVLRLHADCLIEEGGRMLFEGSEGSLMPKFMKPLQGQNHYGLTIDYEGAEVGLKSEAKVLALDFQRRFRKYFNEAKAVSDDQLHALWVRYGLKEFRGKVEEMVCTMADLVLPAKRWVEYYEEKIEKLKSVQSKKEEIKIRKEIKDKIRMDPEFYENFMKNKAVLQAGLVLLGKIRSICDDNKLLDREEVVLYDEVLKQLEKHMETLDHLEQHLKKMGMYPGNDDGMKMQT